MAFTMNVLDLRVGVTSVVFLASVDFFLKNSLLIPKYLSTHSYTEGSLAVFE